jgi:hypothetical protein
MRTSFQGCRPKLDRSIRFSFFSNLGLRPLQSHHCHIPYCTNKHISKQNGLWFWRLKDTFSAQGTLRALFRLQNEACSKSECSVGRDRRKWLRYHSAQKISSSLAELTVLKCRKENVTLLSRHTSTARIKLFPLLLTVIPAKLKYVEVLIYFIVRKYCVG